MTRKLISPLFVILLTAFLSPGLRAQESLGIDHAEVNGTSIEIAASAATLGPSAWDVENSNPSVSPNEAIRLARSAVREYETDRNTWHLYQLTLRRVQFAQQESWVWIVMFELDDGSVALSGPGSYLIIGCTMEGKILKPRTSEGRSGFIGDPESLPLFVMPGAKVDPAEDEESEAESAPAAAETNESPAGLH